MNIMDITGAVRDQTGKTHSRTDRRENKIPCVLYGGQEVKYFTVGELEVRDLIYTPDFKVAQIELNGSKHRCIVKDIQFHPLTDEILHIDFMELVDGKEIKVEIPLRLRGAAPGVKSGGNLIHKMRTVSVKAKPENLVDELSVDISSLELGITLKVRDIELEEGIEILNDGGIPVASVEVPRALKSLTAMEEEEEEEEALEGEEGETEGAEEETSTSEEGEDTEEQKE